MKKLILPIVSVVLFFALAFGSFFMWPRYQQYRTTCVLRQARGFLASGEFVKASLCARKVLQSESTNLEACGIMAELAEISRSPAALDWRQRIAALAPSLQNRIKLASTALRFQRPPYTLAAQTLRDLDPIGRDVAAFHMVSAELALKLDNTTQAISHFEQAARLEPTNELHRFNLAVLHLQSANPDAAANARLVLERLSTNRDLSVLALRWRVAESLRQQDLSGAESLSDRLLADPRAGLQDRLRHLTILRLRQSSRFQLNLQAVQAGAAGNVADLYTVCEWMGTHGMANEAISWLRGFDTKVRETQPVPLALANLYLAKEDWPGLESCLSGKKWGEVEFLRLALLARAAAGERQDLAVETRWRAARDATGDRLAPLTLLLGMAADWGRDPEDLLWEIGQRFPREAWAPLELEKRYAMTGNTRGLHKLYNSLLSSPANAKDATNRNNFAACSLLLKVNLPQAHEMARDLYCKQPADPMIGSTYAYSLHLQGRTEEGLAVFAKFKPKDLQSPAIALYYGVLLASGRHSEQAAQYLALAETAPLLPEEKDLLSEAKRGLGKSPEF